MLVLSKQKQESGALVFLLSNICQLVTHCALHFVNIRGFSKYVVPVPTNIRNNEDGRYGVP